MPSRSRVISGGFIRAGQPSRLAVTVATPPPATEAWTVSDAANTLTGNFPWVKGSGGTFGWHVDTGTARLNSSAAIAQWGYLDNDWGTDDLMVTLTYAGYTPGTNVVSVGPLVRMPGTVNFTGYGPVILTSGGVSSLLLYRFLNGANVALANGVAVTPHSNMTVSVNARANRIRAYFDGLVRIDVTDVGIPAGHYVGLQGFINGTSDVSVDNLDIRFSATRHVPIQELMSLSLAGVH